MINRTAFWLAPAPKKTLQVVRASLGVALAVFYFFFLIRLAHHSETCQFTGISLAFLPAHSLSAHASFLWVGDLLAIVLSLLFAFDRFTFVCGIALLILHGFLNGGNTPFGWEVLFDPFLMCVILASRKKSRSILPIRIMQVIACVFIGWVSWSQVKSGPWLDTATVTRYVAHSPFGRISSSYPGFVPLVEIIGGFAWLLGLLAPVLLWNKAIGKYWAVLLLLTHGMLTIFMPAIFCNLMAMVAMVSFARPQWLTLEKRYWISQSSELKAAGRIFGFSTLMLVVVSTVFDRNIAEQFDIFQKMGSVITEKTYEIATNPFVKAGNLILFNSIWKMYSPTWRKVVWIEWNVKNRDGTVTKWPEENFSPEYRMHRRTWTEAIWTDFKKEKVFIGMLTGDAPKVAYAKYLCHVIAEKTGTKPVSIQPEIFSFAIRGPELNWSIRNQKFERDEKQAETLCD